MKKQKGEGNYGLERNQPDIKNMLRLSTGTIAYKKYDDAEDLVGLQKKALSWPLYMVKAWYISPSIYQKKQVL